MPALVHVTSRPPTAPQLLAPTLKASFAIGSHFSTAREAAVQAESVSLQMPASELIESCWLDADGLVSNSDGKLSLSSICSKSSTDDQHSCSLKMPDWIVFVDSDIRARRSSWTKRLQSAESTSRLSCSISDTFFAVVLCYMSQQRLDTLLTYLRIPFIGNYTGQLALPDTSC